GFGMEFMSDVMLPTGHYTSGAPDRVDLMANIMEYFGTEPTAPGTGIEGAETFVTKLSHAHPNPFNPATTIAYSLAGRSRVVIRVYDVAGRVVTTLVDGEVDAGPHTIVWDGTTDSGERAASGVYFVRMEGSGDAGVFGKVVKAVMLK
ncbi:T9SS type A sorting domain-containing protein, partial [bacterium]|nr:T9SS type A sorting domain-containing protein [bacterium]